MNTNLMASAVFASPSLSLSSSSYNRSTILSTSGISLNPSSFHFSQWNGFKHFRISIARKSLKRETKGRFNGKVFGSLFGVGAPEALVIGVVALLVFGPKGLAEVARNLGKTFREFQPTIRELQDVSNEFKSTLQREIGLDDDIQTSRKPNRSTNITSVPSDESNGFNKAYSTEDYLKITEEQLKARATQTAPDFFEEVSSESSANVIKEAAPVLPAPQKEESSEL